MTPRITYLTAVAGLALALVAVPTAWGQSQAISPDAFERAVIASELASRSDASVVNTYRDAFERAAASQGRRSALGSNRDASERGGALDLGPSTVNRYPDAVDRAVGQRVQSGSVVGHVDRYEIDLPSGPVTTPVTASGREIEWPELGVGFGLGILLGLGLFLATRMTRIRPLAH